MRPDITDFQIIENESVVLVKHDDLRIIQLQTLEERHYQIPEALGTAKVILTKQQIIAISNQEVRRLALSSVFRGD
ncbi:MAG: hypothetical protein IPL46_12180 [Saprospiraceae bacterium]|nr:hypothetical protein [Saprospiraceae bacterium]